jgi:hypothetical protein
MFDDPVLIDGMITALGGKSCACNGATFVAILNSPSIPFGVGEVMVLSTEYELTFRSSAVAITREADVSVAGIAFRARETPRLTDDGVLSRVFLTRVA